MGKQARVPFRRRQIGRTLRRMREQVGMTQDEAGAKLEFSAPKMSRIEGGQLPGIHEFRAMLDLYGLPISDWEPHIAAFKQAKVNGWWRSYGLNDQGYVSMEDEASLVCEYQNGFIPGLLQTESYAHAIFAASSMPRSKRAIENQIAIRIRRQDRLTCEPVLRLHTIIDEAVLHQRIPPTILRDQLSMITQRANLENVTVQVLPRDIEPHDGLLGEFTVLNFADPDDDDIAYVEHAFGSVHIEDAEDVRAAKLRFDQLSGLALSEEDSLLLLERLARET